MDRRTATRDERHELIADGVTQVSSRSFTLTAATTAVLAALALLPTYGAGQTPTAAEKIWNPPRTPDGQPDIQGFWSNQGRRLATYNIEAAADERHVLFGGTDDDHSLSWTRHGKFLTSPGQGETAGGFDNQPTYEWEGIPAHPVVFPASSPALIRDSSDFRSGSSSSCRSSNHGSRIIPGGRRILQRTQRGWGTRGPLCRIRC